MTGVEPGTVMNESERTSLIRTLYMQTGYCQLDIVILKVLVTHSHIVRRETDIWHTIGKDQTDTRYRGWVLFIGKLKDAIQ